MPAATVTRRIKEIKQPYGGYLKISEFEKKHIQDDFCLNLKENINAGFVGIAVDYLTRFCLGNNVEDAFRTCITGSFNVKEYERCISLIDSISGLDDFSIVAACKLAMYDAVYRCGKNAYMAPDEITPDEQTIGNIRMMVKRSTKFFKEEKIKAIGYTFKNQGHIILSDCDYVAKDTLWDMKVIRNNPDKDKTLQVLMYWIMGNHTKDQIFKGVNKVGIYNPRLNVVYSFDVGKISGEVISEIEHEVIGY